MLWSSHSGDGPRRDPRELSPAGARRVLPWLWHYALALLPGLSDRNTWVSHFIMVSTPHPTPGLIWSTESAKLPDRVSSFRIITLNAVRRTADWLSPYLVPGTEYMRTEYVSTLLRAILITVP